MPAPLKVIDLFAGPGGLGEGFSSCRSRSGDVAFKIALSIENNPSAHKTLALRSFYRQFPEDHVPPEYFEYIAGNRGKHPEDSLFSIRRLRRQVSAALKEARLLTLGKDNRAVNNAISEALGKRSGPWILIGGPPCQAYSLVGRARNRGVFNYRAENDHRNFLYREYLKVIARFSPDIFVMENVKGMLSATVRGENMFSRIRDDLLCPARVLGSKDPRINYEVFPFVRTDNSRDFFDPVVSPTEFVIKSEQFGVPQTRHRVIILGIRTDRLSGASFQPLQKSTAPSVKHSINDLPRLRSGLSKSTDGLEEWKSTIASEIESVAQAVIKKGQADVAQLMIRSVDKILGSTLNRGTNWSIMPSSKISDCLSSELKDWYSSPAKTRLITNHDARAHIGKDLLRYLYCACFAVARFNSGRASPVSSDFPDVLAPHHASWASGSFADRFRVQASDAAASTITSHISKDGHYFIHYDPTQCRSLTVREAARIQTFPDSYFFAGTRTQQYTQVGNAVPPYLAKQLAQVVFDIVTT